MKQIKPLQSISQRSFLIHAFCFAVAMKFVLAGALPAADFFVATNGDDENVGTIDSPFASIQRAQESVEPGDTVFIRGGTYRIQPSQIAYERRIWAHVIRLDKSGAERNRINYWAYANETPVFDFSQVKPANKRVHAFSVSGSWLHLKGIEVVGVQVTMTGHTQSICFANDGSENIYESLSMHDGHAIGVYSVKGKNNLFLNCDAYRNYDPVSEGGRGGNVDGFGCHPTPGSTGNMFRGCRAWFNSDDGFDCISASESVTFENCWAFWNGYTTDFKSRADGNGFKIGGFGSLSAQRLPRTIPRHVVRQCIAVKNKANGFYGNHHIGGSDWLNNTAFANGCNFNFLSRLADNVTDVAGYGHFLRNNLSHASRRLATELDSSKSDVLHNSFTEEMLVTDADFESLDSSQLTLPRQPDGSLPEISFLHLAQDSQLVDRGMDVELPFTGKSPDYGAFERNLNSPSATEPLADSPPLRFQFSPGLAWPGFTLIEPDSIYSEETGFGFEPGSVPEGHSGSLFFSARVPEGNYRVRATLGDRASEATTTVKAELRRLMLENVQTQPGEFITRSFIVNVRTPQIAGGGSVRLKVPRETVDEAWAWDERLTLEFNGENPSVVAIEIEPVDVPTVFLMGDSTVCDQSKEPYASWGQMLPRFFRPEIAVANHAESGDSLRSSQGARRLEKVLGEIQAGDFVLIQFGHNDMKSKEANASERFAESLTDWVRQIKSAGATPVLITPVRRHRFKGEQVVDSLLDYPDRVRRVAEHSNVPLVDLNAMSKTLYETLGPQGSILLFKHDYEGDPKFDATHHSPYGAYELARCVINGLRQADVSIAKFSVEDMSEFDPSHPDSFASFKIPPSPSHTTQRPLGD